MSPTKIAAVFLACLITPSCSSPQRAAAPVEPAPEEPVAKKKAEPEPAEPALPIARGVVADNDKPVQLPLTGTAPAPWLEDSLTTKPVSYTDGAETVASGMRAAMIRNAKGQYFGFHADRGVIGKLAIPSDARWVGFGRKDEVLYADAAGQLHNAASLRDAAKASHYGKRGQAPGAVLWDSAPDILAASDGTRVWVSTDGGASFVESAPKVNGKIDKVFARAGKIVVITVAGRDKRIVPWISTDGGTTFKRSRLRPNRLIRTGPWIWNRDWECAVVLSTDGKTWVRPTETETTKAHNTSSWMAPLQTAASLDGYNREPDWATPTYPTLPSPTRKNRQRGASPCPPVDDGEGVEGGVMGGVVGGVLGGIGGTTSGPRCRGAECLRSDDAPLLPKTQTNFLLLRDAYCYATSKWAWACDSKRKPKRMPHTVVADHVTGAATFGALPDGCFPAKIVSARGLGILLCRTDTGTDLWTASKTVAWKREYTTKLEPAHLWNFSVAQDGTVLAQLACPPKQLRCSAAVRRPVAPGSANAWYEVTDVGAMTHRPVVGGRVLIATDEAGSLALSLAQSSDQRRAIIKPIDFKRSITKLRIDDQGRIQVRVHKQGGFRYDAYFVGADGKTHESKWPEPKRSKHGYIIAKPRAFDPTHR